MKIYFQIALAIYTNMFMTSPVFTQEREKDFLKPDRTRIMEKYDRNRDSELDEGERHAFRRDHSEQLQKLLKRWDENSNGELDLEESAAARAAMQKKKENLRKRILEKFDWDGDGELNEKEKQALQHEREARKEQRRREQGEEGKVLAGDNEQDLLFNQRMKKFFDKNGNDQLEPEERQFAQQAMRYVRRQTDRARENGNASFLLRFDSNHDGSLDDIERQELIRAAEEKIRLVQQSRPDRYPGEGRERKEKSEDRKVPRLPERRRNKPIEHKERINPEAPDQKRDS